MLVIKNNVSLDKLTDLGFEFRNENYDIDGKIVNIQYYEYMFEGMSLIRISSMRNIYLTHIDSQVLADYQNAIYEKLYDLTVAGLIDKF